MSIEFYRFLGWIVFGSIGFGLAVLLPCWILLTIFTPKIVLENIFKEPHFTLTETYMLKAFPGSFLRTSIFGVLLLWPKKGKRRQLMDLRGNVPRWFDWSARLLAIAWLADWTIAVFLIALLNLVEPIP